MMHRDAHPALRQCIENCFCQFMLSEHFLHGGMGENVHRGGEAQRRKSLSANSRGFALVNYSNPILTDSVGDGCRLTVIEGHLSGPDYQLFEMRFSHVVEPDDFDEPGNHKFIQKVGVLPDPVPPSLQFFRNDIDDSHTIGNGFDERVTAPGRIYIYDGTGIGNQKGSRVSQPRWG
jgi:hypothetical protein